MDATAAASAGAPGCAGAAVYTSASAARQGGILRARSSVLRVGGTVRAAPAPRARLVDSVEVERSAWRPNRRRPRLAVTRPPMWSAMGRHPAV